MASRTPFLLALASICTLFLSLSSSQTHLPFPLPSKAAMASQNPSILFTILLGLTLIPHHGYGSEGRASHGLLDTSISPSKDFLLQGLGREGFKQSARKVMVGSTAPICTYNECRRCRWKCSAEQVPVDAGHPKNSAYHYKCVCHR